MVPGKHRIGRTAGNDVVIYELAVSDHHCILTIENNGASIADNGSIHGTFIDGALIHQCQVRPGQIINLGTLMVKLLAGNEVSGRKTDATLESVPLEDGSFSCLKHPDMRATYECPSCNHLFCDACLSKKVVQPPCPGCGKDAEAIDWSGLEITLKEAAFELMPDSMKKAWGYWRKWQSRRNQ